ncbi:MAG: N-6 DNA methylase, partial [Gemmatimonadota bacterium]|nr:N-6 DNA methylase [Gemmatimonadota bacterium]
MKLRHPPQVFEPYSLSETLGGVAGTVGRHAEQLEPEVAAYQIGLTYTSLLPPAYRSANGIYYTPPALTQRLIKLATETGVDWKNCRILDPACGGGAFLAPVAKHIIEQMPECSPRILLENISTRLRGYEIDPFGAWLAQVTLDVVLLPIYSATGKKTPCLVTLCNSLLKNPPRDGFDLVIGNPPYARTQLTPELREKFKRGIYGHA